MADVALSNDPLWPRAGDWPAPESLAPEASARLALLGVPAWRTSLSPTDAHTTPAAVRQALRRYSPALVPSRQEGRDAVDLGEQAVVDAGDIVEPDGPEGETRTRARVAELLERAETVMALGGDNSVTVATALGAYGDRLDTAGLITIDAHYDLRDGVSNGSPVRRLVEAGLDPRRIVQIGIADFANSRAYRQRAKDLGITVIHRDELHERPLREIVAEALDIAGAAGGPIHADLDVDVCDRSVAPGCPASIPGGLQAHELRTIARLLAADTRVRGVDIAEVDSTADTADARTVRLAAMLVLEAGAGLAQRLGR